jgi:hypothetical protein
LAAGAAAALLPAAAFAQSFPNRPIRFVVPFPPGGSLDVSARAVADRMTVLLGQPVVVENRPGAGGNVGADLVAKSAPDGYTMLMGALSTHAVNPHLYARMPFEPLKDFAPITQIGDVPNILIVGPSVKAANVQELARDIRANPKAFNYGSGGNGSGGHLAGALFADRIGVPIEHIPYQGGAPQLNALLSERRSSRSTISQTRFRRSKRGACALLPSRRRSAARKCPTCRRWPRPGFRASTSVPGSASSCLRACRPMRPRGLRMRPSPRSRIRRRSSVWPALRSCRSAIRLPSSGGSLRPSMPNIARSSACRVRGSIECSSA